MVNYKDIHEIIDIHNSNKSDDKAKIVFPNQTIGAISLQPRKIVMNMIQKELNVVKNSGYNF